MEGFLQSFHNESEINVGEIDTSDSNDEFNRGKVKD